MEEERARFMASLKEAIGEGGTGKEENQEAEADFWKNERLPFSVSLFNLSTVVVDTVCSCCR